MKYHKSYGFIMKNQMKEKENHPDATGKIALTEDQIKTLWQMHKDGYEPEIRISGWVKKSKAGNKFTSIEAQAFYDANNPPRKSEPPPRQSVPDDDIPF